MRIQAGGRLSMLCESTLLNILRLELIFCCSFECFQHERQSGDSHVEGENGLDIHIVFHFGIELFSLMTLAIVDRCGKCQ